MSKLTKIERNEVKSFIQFEDGKIVDKETLEEDLIKFCNKKYCEKYKSDENYKHIREEKYFNLDGTEVDRTIVSDNEFIERTSVILYQQSIKDRKLRGIKTKNDSYNIEVIGQRDIGEKRQWLEYYQLNGQKIYVDKMSSDDYSEQSTVQFQIESVYAQKYSETERVVDNAINSLFEQYYNSNHKNEVLYRLLIHLNDDQLDYFSYQSLLLFLQQELKNYRILDNQQKVLDRILLCGEIPDANQKKILKRLLKISKKKS